MKKIYYLALSLLLCSCSIEINKGERNAEEFVKSKIDTDIIESIEVQPCDSLPSSLLVTWAHKDYLEGKITDDEFIETLTNVNNSLATKGSMKCEGMESWLRKAYTVVVKTKDGRTTDIQVIMDNDGTTPVTTGGEMCQEIEEYLNQRAKSSVVAMTFKSP